MDKNTIIYIGDDDKMSSFLSNHFTLLQVKDISEFYKKYDSLKLRNIHSIIVDFWDEDVKTFLFHKHNAELFILAKIPFLLYARNKVSSKNKNIAKSQGIDDIIAHSFDETALLLRILWLKNHTNDKLEKLIIYKKIGRKDFSVETLFRHFFFVHSHRPCLSYPFVDNHFIKTRIKRSYFLHQQTRWYGL